MVKELVVFGSFGFGNIGDEAVPMAIDDLMQDRKLGCKIHVASRFANPAMPGVVGISNDYRHDLARLSNKATIISGGGVIEPRANSCILKFTAYQKQAQPQSVSILGGSFEYEVDYSWQQRRRISKVLAQMDHIYTRDYLSEIYLSRIFPGNAVVTIGDVVLALKPDYQYTLPTPLSAHEYIAVSLCQRWQQDPGWQDWIATELLKLSNTYDKPLLFVALSQHYDADQQLHQQLAERLKQMSIKHLPYVIEQILNPRQAAKIYQNAYLTISMRLHGCVISYAQKTPFVGLCYHPKLIGFALTVGWAAFLLPRGMQVEHDYNRYGVAFKPINFADNDLLKSSDNALSFGEFKLLPLLIENIGCAIEEIVAD